MKITEKQIIKNAVIKCPLDAMWWKWTTHEGLMTFFGKDNKIGLYPEGPFEIYFNMNSPEGLRGSEGCKVLSFLPNQMFSFSWNAPPSIMDARNSDHHTWVIVHFKPLSGETTEITVTHLGWPEGNLWQEVYDYFDSAWSTVMRQLDESCKQ